MSLIGRPAVVAGVDGSARDPAVLARAALTARQCDAPLQVVHVVGPDLDAGQQVLRAARRILADTGAPDEVDYDLRAGTPAGALRCPALNATLLVVGAPVDAWPTRHPSAAELLAADSRVPVLAVRRAEQGGPVLAALDGSPRSWHVLAYAIEEAALGGSRLRVLHVAPGPGCALPRPIEVPLGLWREKFPEVEVEIAVHGGDPTAELVAESRRAGLVVLGSRPPGRFAANLLGAVSRHVLYGAECDVAVV